MKIHIKVKIAIKILKCFRRLVPLRNESGSVAEVLCKPINISSI